MKSTRFICFLILLILGMSALIACSNYPLIVTPYRFVDITASANESSILINRSTNELITTEDEVRILQLTDVQFQSLLNERHAGSEVNAMVEKTNPDLIVFTGDTLHNGGEKEHLEAFIEFMDGFETPWAVVMGNHDYTSRVDIDVQASLYESSKYCIFKKGELEGSCGNYQYTLIKDNIPFYSLIFMDSGEEGFTEEHVEWYESTVNKTLLKYKNNIQNLLFYHIPIFEADAVYNEYADYKIFGSGELREDICAQERDVNFLKKVLDLGSTTNMFFGHDHVNDAFTEYMGVGFHYGLKTGSNSYSDSDMQGGNLIVVTTRGNVLVERIFN